MLDPTFQKLAYMILGITIAFILLSILIVMIFAFFENLKKSNLVGLLKDFSEGEKKEKNFADQKLVPSVNSFGVQPTQRRRGRPRKQESQEKKTKRGRPPKKVSQKEERKLMIAPVFQEEKKRRGRPPKNKPQPEEKKTKRGRPSQKEVRENFKKRGRPPKKETRKRGRPRKKYI